MYIIHKSFEKLTSSLPQPAKTATSFSFTEPPIEIFAGLTLLLNSITGFTRNKAISFCFVLLSYFS